VSTADRDKWDARWAEAAGPPRPPDPFVQGLDALLPRTGRALDLAAGRGRYAVWLAERGLDVTAVDVSPIGLERAAAHAADHGVSIATVVRDLEEEGAPEGPWDVITCVGFLHRPLYRALPGLLAPGGWLIIVQGTRRNLERHQHPSARYLLEQVELPSLLDDVEVVRHVEGWTTAGRHHARIAARRVGP